MSSTHQPELPAPIYPWRSIDELEPSDDLFWFLGQWDGKSWTVDGPRVPQSGGYDADEWDYFCAAEAPPTTHAASRPADGDWVMVPREPTNEMQVAGWGAHWHDTNSRDVWSAMIAAAPNAAVGETASQERARLLVPVLKKSSDYWGNHHCASELKRAIEIIEDLLLDEPTASAPTSAQAGDANDAAYWKGEAERYALNADYWRKRCEGESPTPDAAARASTGPLVALRDKWASRTGTLTYDLAAVELDTAIEASITTPSDAGGEAVFGYQFTEEDLAAFVQLRDSLEKIVSGMTSTDTRHFLVPGKPRKMTIKDAQEAAAAFIPFISGMIANARDTGYTTPPNPGDARLRALAESWIEQGERRETAGRLKLTQCGRELLSLLDGKGE